MDVLEREQTGELSNPIAFKFFTRELRAIHIKAADSASGNDEYYLEAPASSNVTDRMGDVINLQAQKQMEKACKRLTIFLNHSYDVPEDIFGTCEGSELKAAHDKKQGDCFDLIVRTRITNPAENTRAMKTWRHVQDGARLGYSIGGQVLEFKYIDEDDDSWFAPIEIMSIDLYEISVVGIPANQRAIIDDVAKGIRKAMNPNDKAAEKAAELKKIEDAKAAQLARGVNFGAGADPSDAEIEAAAAKKAEDEKAAADKAAGDKGLVIKVSADTSEAKTELEKLSVQLKELKATADVLTADVAAKKLEAEGLDKKIAELKDTPLGRRTRAYGANGISGGSTVDPEIRRRPQHEIEAELSMAMSGQTSDPRIRNA